MVKIAVVITVFNRTTGLSQSLESVMKQQHPADEILVVDDGSESHIEQQIEQIGRQHEAVKLIRHCTNKGVSAARNSAINHLTADFVIFLDDDDLLYPNAVESAQVALADGPVDVVIRQVNMEHESTFWQKHFHRQAAQMSNQPIDHPNWFFQYAPAIHGMVFRVERLRKNPFNESLIYGEDRVLALELLTSGASFLVKDDVVGAYKPGKAQVHSSPKIDFANYVLEKCLYRYKSQKAYLNLFKSLIHLRSGKLLKSVQCLFYALERPGLVLQYLWVWLRK